MNSADRQAVLHCLKVMIGEELCEECLLYGTTGTDHCEEDCIRLAINALEQEPKESRSEIPNTCDDAISRDKAIVQLSHLLSDWDDDWNVGIRKCIETVKGVPSVTPQQRTGHWIAQDIHNCHTDFKCSECGYIHSFMHLYGKPTADYTYCPNCGAKMEVEE